MNDDLLALDILDQDRSTFEIDVFEMLFGADASPVSNIEELTNQPERIFNYGDASTALTDASAKLELFFKLRQHYSTDGGDYTEEQFEFWDLLRRLGDTTRFTT